MKNNSSNKGFSYHFILPLLAIMAVIAIGFLTLRLGKADTVAPDGTFRVATYNIRATRLSKSAWDNKRANAILKYIKSIDIVGLQETQREAVNLGTKHKSVSVANRSENWLTNKLVAAGFSRSAPTKSPRYGEKAYDNGEDRVIFWNNQKFTLVTQGQKSVSDDTTGVNDETANEGNESLAKHRNLVWVKLRETTSGKIFYFLTTHLTWGGSTGTYEPIRGTQITQIIDYVNQQMTDAPVILVGDMNSRSGSPEDKCFTDGFPDAKNMLNAKGNLIYYPECTHRQGGGFSDAYKTATTKQNMNYSTTITSFKGKLTGSVNTVNGRHIDHIYTKGAISVSRIEVVKQKGSDHLPVEADVSL